MRKSEASTAGRESESVPGGLSSSESLFEMFDVLDRFSGQIGFLFERLQRDIEFIKKMQYVHYELLKRKSVDERPQQKE